MMSKTIKTILTLAVIFFTAINIYRLELDQPPYDPVSDPNDIAYRHYMMLHSVLASLFVIGTMLVWFTGYTNRIIRTCILMNAILFGYCIFKVIFMEPDKHYNFDWTVSGIALIYLVNPYWKDLLTLAKTIINEIHLRCRLPKKKRKVG